MVDQQEIGWPVYVVAFLVAACLVVTTWSFILAQFGLSWDAVRMLLE
jgi:hypothetical protein